MMAHRDSVNTDRLLNGSMMSSGSGATGSNSLKESSYNGFPTSNFSCVSSSITSSANSLMNKLKGIKKRGRKGERIRDNREYARLYQYTRNRRAYSGSGNMNMSSSLNFAPGSMGVIGEDNEASMNANNSNSNGGGQNNTLELDSLGNTDSNGAKARQNSDAAHASSGGQRVSGMNTNTNSEENELLTNSNDFNSSYRLENYAPVRSSR